MRILGIALVIAGALALIYGGITYTREEKVLDLGPISATARQRETIDVPPIVGGVVLAVGAVLIAASWRRR
jgi:hypothetical protein